MIQIRYHKGFIREFKELPQPIRLKAAHLEVLFREFPFHPQLKTKKLQGKLQHLYSFRITRDYRIIFQFTAAEEAEFLMIKHRKDVYR